MPDSVPQKKIQIILPQTLQKSLSHCAKRQTKSVGLVMREAATAYLRMMETDIPTCADGAPCQCPQMVPRRGLQQSIPGSNLPPNIPKPSTRKAAA